MTSSPGRAPRPEATDSEYAAAARRLADRLLSLAEPGPGGAPAWSGDDVDLDHSTEQQVVLAHGRLDDGLLTGRSGIATTLAAAGRLPGARPEWTVVARQAASSAVQIALRTPSDVADLGWSIGWLGIARGAHLVAGWTQDDRLAAAARTLAGRAVATLAHASERCPDYPDLLDGLAGHLTAVLGADLDPSMEPVRHRAASGLLARLLGFATAESARLDAPISWPMAGSGPAVIGLAHGGSGITVALTAAAAAGVAGPPGTGDLGDVTARTRHWEDAYFRAAAGGWPDLRAGADVPGLAWCHGAPGVGVAAAFRALAGARDGTEDTFARAAATVRTYGRPSGPAPFDGTLCHGLTGLVELHLLGAEAWPAAGREHLAEARLLARHLTRAGQAGRPGWVCGIRGGRTPALLTGLAGVAYTLVRCHQPALAPSLSHPGLPVRTLAAAAV